jgi:Ca2+-binding EF-hand superfamily protein
MQQGLSETNVENTMNTLRILTTAIVATFAVAAQAGPYGPGAGGPANPGAGNVNGATYGAGYGPGAGGGCRGAGQGERLKAADTNADGFISREEAQASLPGLATRFDAIDSNKDGNISLAELGSARGTFGRGARGEGWKKWDVNGDGKLAREEVANAPRLAQEFDAIDANKDGFLALEELQAARGQYAHRGWHRGY